MVHYLLIIFINEFRLINSVSKLMRETQMSSKHRTKSFLSRLAFLRADVTALASFSAIQALNIFTAKEADIPTKQRVGKKSTDSVNNFLNSHMNSLLMQINSQFSLKAQKAQTFFDKVIAEEAGEDRWRQCAVGQQDAC